MSEATIIDGKSFAAGLRERVGAEVARLKAEHGVTPGLAVVLVGEDPASKVYVGSKAKQTVEAGMESFEHRLDESASEDELLALIDTLNNDDAVNGILVQLPLPKQIDDQKVLAAINPDKDVDGFHTTNVGRLWTGGDALVPCTPFGCLLLLRDHLGDLSGKNAVVVGRSNIVGKPMAALLIGDSCTVTVAHSRTQDLPGKCREADILVAAVGRPEMVKGDWVKPGATVIDVGINRVEAPEKGRNEDGSIKTKLVGDVDFAGAAKVAGAITPVPGGVGPMTIACLLRNTLVACCRQNGLADPKVDF
ncbi:MAG: bifunctional methylenetetrahydrofolate dehydrogenase/methenyltetrahydrofolate cyclohydrolase FolD [Rhodospirillales bacterium]